MWNDAPICRVELSEGKHRRQLPAKRLQLQPAGPFLRKLWRWWEWSA